MTGSLEKMRALVDRLNETAKAYYAGTPMIADMQWVESQKWLVTVGFDSSICVWVLNK